MSEDLIYNGKISQQTAQESAAWSYNNYIVDSQESAFAERWRDDFSRFQCWKKESCNLHDPSCALRKKKTHLHSLQINRTASKKILALPATTFFSSPLRSQILAQESDLITTSNPRRNEVKNGFVSKHVQVNYKN